MGGKKSRQAREREGRVEAPAHMVEVAEWIAKSNKWHIQAYSRHHGQWWVTFLNPEATDSTAQFSVSEQACLDTLESWLATDEGKEWSSHGNTPME